MAPLGRGKVLDCCGEQIQPCLVSALPSILQAQRQAVPWLAYFQLTPFDMSTERETGRVGALEEDEEEDGRSSTRTSSDSECTVSLSETHDPRRMAALEGLEV